MLPSTTANALRQLNVPATHAQEFISGLKLMQLVSQVFHHGQTHLLLPKLRISDENKTGNNVLNINIILNSIKKNSSIEPPDKIKNLTAFQLIENEQIMVEFIDWIISQHRPGKEQNIEMSPPRQQENQFQNLYFVSSLEKKNDILNDSLQQQNLEQKVVPRGSFKMLKPKASSTGEKSYSKQNSLDKAQGHVSTKQLKYEEQPLRQLAYKNNSQHYGDDQDDINIRKTIPRMYEKPPLYRNRQKQNDQKANSPSTMKQNNLNQLRSKLKSKQQISKDIQSLKAQIEEQERSMMTSNAPTVVLNSSAKGKAEGKSIFKMVIPETDDSRKKALIEWLININILSIRSSKCIQSLSDICKDGVIFMEICNYYRGRGRELCYFKAPKRSAQKHSNYQKLFSSIQNIPQFASQLIFKYQYFIPQIQTNAFWNLMSSLYSCFHRQVKPDLATDQQINRYSNKVSARVQTALNSQKMMNNSLSYNQIKYNSSSLQKQKPRQKQQGKRSAMTHSSSLQGPRKQTPKLIKRDSSQSSQKMSNKGVPHGLIQNQQPVDQTFKTERGYKEMYLCKFKNMETPKKNQSSLINSSLSRSRLRSFGSSKKIQKRMIIPSISLQMQMKVLSYLKQFALEEENVQLFKDPCRNGLLLGWIIKKQLNCDCLASSKPKSIDDCRNNFINGIQAMKIKLKGLSGSYESCIEQLLKGQKSLLFGLIWQLIKQRKQVMGEGNARRQRSSKVVLNNLQSEQQYISWIRMLEKISGEIASLKIRNEASLFNAVISTDFLYYYGWIITNKKTITPNYPQTMNSVQKESNLKKVIGFLVQHKIIRSDYLWKTKSLMKKEKNIINQLINDLITYYSHLHNKEQMKTINFIKYTRDHSHEPQEKHREKLETTMANQTSINHTKIEQPAPKVEINWMRKLGFHGSLDLNNGVVLCRLISKLSMKTIEGVNQSPQSRAECLGNIRKAIKMVPKFRWDEFDVIEGNYHTTVQIYGFLRQAYKHCYALKTA